MKNFFLVLIIVVSTFLGCKNNSEETTISPEDKERIQLVEHLKNMIRQSPDSASARMLLVNTLDSLGLYAEAISQVDSLILRDSVNNGLWYAKAQLHESNGDTLAAINSYEKALQIYPSIESQLNLANLLAEHKDRRALELCQNLAKVGMDRETDAHINFIAGVYHARTGNVDKAIKFFDRCINNNYTYMEAYMEKGFLFYENKNYQQAMDIFDKAITVSNTYADAYYWKAKTFEAMGNKQDAIVSYQQALALDKNLKEAGAALQRLKG
jgi:tetratricopeptide (TPR) repeat protein